MRTIRTFTIHKPGARSHAKGVWPPRLRALLLVAAAPMLFGCAGDDETVTLEPVVLGMTSELAATLSTDEMEIYEVKLPVQLPIERPTREQRRALNQMEAPAPFERHPWVTIDDVEVQVSWTVTNLDEGTHEVNLLIDPWNEFGRYWPGAAVVDDDEIVPNLSGIQDFFELKGTEQGEESRVHGTVTFDDMRELAIDLSTVMNILENVPPPDESSEYGETGPVTLVNHTFSFRNLSTNDPLVERFIPPVAAGITGFDVGLRTMTPANLSLEIIVEVTDRHGRVAGQSSFECVQGECRWTGKDGKNLLRPADAIITAGTG